MKNKAKETTKRPDENTQPSRRGHARDGGLEKGDKQFLNVAGGVRPVLGQYDEPDTVLMVELNWERAGRDDLGGTGLADTGLGAVCLARVMVDLRANRDPRRGTDPHRRRPQRQSGHVGLPGTGRVHLPLLRRVGRQDAN